MIKAYKVILAEDGEPVNNLGNWPRYTYRGDFCGRGYDCGYYDDLDVAKSLAQSYCDEFGLDYDTLSIEELYIEPIDPDDPECGLHPWSPEPYIDGEPVYEDVSGVLDWHEIY